MWETSLKFYQVWDVCHHIHFPHCIIRLLKRISNGISTACLKWLCSYAPESTSATGVFLRSRGVNLHWVIMTYLFFFPLSPHYLNVYAFPLEAHTPSSSVQPIAQLAMLVWDWGLLILAPACMPFIILVNSGACLTAAHYWLPGTGSGINDSGSVTSLQPN